MNTSCDVCKAECSAADLVPLSVIRPSLQKFILEKYPALNPESRLCSADLHELRNLYLEQMLEEEKGEVTELEEDVLRSIREQDLITSNTNTEFSEGRSFGERLSDQLAFFGGSWSFIILFGTVLTLWIAWNAMRSNTFDPYPFILLNLVLSCLAAIQAPIIMMSQNRQETKDRLRAENDYRINLKAELEVRHLNEKMDHLVMRQWQRLLEIQQLQVQLLEELRQVRSAETHDAASR